MKQTIVGLYDRMDDAQNSVRALRDAGFKGSDISLLVNDVNGQWGRTLDKKSSSAPSATAGGSTAGGALGGIGSLLTGINPQTIPGIGPVIAAGPLASSATRDLVHPLVDMGVPDSEAQFYAEGVRRGGELVAVNVDDNKSSQVRQILQSHHSVNFQERVAQWRQSGWSGYDPNAKPFTNEQITREQGMHTYNR